MGAGEGEILHHLHRCVRIAGGALAHGGGKARVGPLRARGDRRGENGKTEKTYNISSVQQHFDLKMLNL